MDYQKALDILGLKHNFTEEEFKTSYRRLSQMYHPDKYKEGTELQLQMLRKQQDINAAKEYIQKHLRENNLDNYKTKKLSDLKIFISEDTNIADHDFQEMKSKVNSVIYTFETDIWMSFVKTHQQVDSMYDLAIKAIKNILENFITQFYQKNYIDRTEVKENINFENNLEKIYEQLLKIREKYSKEVKVNKQLDEEIEQYKGYAGYEKIEYLVNICKKNALYYIKQNNFQNIEQEILKMHQQIIHDVFDVYYTLKKKLSDLESIVNNIPDESIKNEYFTIYNNFEFGTSFYDTEKSIQKLEQRISEYREIELKKQNQKVIEESINKIYQSLIIRYSEVVKQYNIVTESKEINKLNELLMEILKLFSKGCEEFKTLEFFRNFDNITFTDETNDREIVENTIQEQKTNKSNVYIKTTNNYMFDDTSFFYLDEENMIMYKIYYSDTMTQKITEEELATEYISIEEVLKSAAYVGEYRKMYGTWTIKYLYETDKIAIYYKGQKFEITPKTKLYNLKTIKPRDESFEPFKSKQYVCEMIEKQVREQVEEYKKQQAQKSGSYSPNPNIYGQPPFNTDDYYNNESSTRRRR